MEKIIIQDIEGFEAKKQAMKKAGASKLHILSDFDRTITKGTMKGKRTETVIAKLRSDPKYLGEDYAEKAHAEFNYYHPIEIDPDIPFEEKKEKMREWWYKHFNLLIEAGFSKQVMEQVVKEKPLDFREGALEFVKTLEKNNIPLVFMSAGPGDMLIEYLKYNNLLTDNVRVVGNRYKFDKNGKAIEIIEPITHVLNKTETSLREYPIYRDIEKRKNVILMGDSIGDVGMAEGLDCDNIIKIGFLNENVEENLELFKDNFDVVILNDGDFSFVNKLLKDILE